MYAFLMGTGSCGSSLVYELLAAHPRVGFVSNLDDRLWRLNNLGRLNGHIYRLLPQQHAHVGIRFRPSEAYRLLTGQVSPELARPDRPLTGRDLSDRERDSLGDFFQRRRAAQHADVFLHKFTGASKADLIAASLPTTRFVHIVRDGRAVAASMSVQPWWSSRGGSRSQWHRATSVRGELSTQEGDLRLAAHAWQTMMRSYEESASAGTPDWLTIRYEDILDRPTESFALILDHLGLAPVGRVWEYIAAGGIDASPRNRWREVMPPADVEETTRILSAELTRYGYVDRP